jgi:acetylornithine deacetylase/succinyl-diaminopimelate desuccinylase-like protein
MKGFLALAVNRLLAADRLGRPLALLVTYDEEVGTLGARALAEAGGSSIPLPSRTLSRRRFAKRSATRTGSSRPSV